MSRSPKARKIVRITLKIFLGIFVLLIFLLLSVWILVKTEWGNRKLTSFTASYLSSKFRSKVIIESIDLTDLARPRITGVDLRDPQGNLVASFDTLQLGLDLRALLSRSVNLDQVSLSGLKLRVSRSAETGKFNYQFMVDAFSGAQHAPADTSTSGWAVALQALSLRNADIHYVDAVSRDSFLVSLHSLSTSMKGSDVQKPLIITDVIRVDSLQAFVQVGKSPATTGKPADEEPLALTMAIRALQAGYVNIRLRTLNESLSMQSVAGAFRVDQLRYSGLKNELLAAGIYLDDHDLQLSYQSMATATADSVPARPESGPAFVVRVDTLAIHNNHIVIRENPLPLHGPGIFAPGDMDLHSLNLAASGLFMVGNQYGVVVNQLQLKDKQGFELNKLSGDLRYSDTALQVSNLRLVTRYNNLSASVRMRYPLLTDITRHPEKVTLSAEIRPSSLLLDEAAYFVPALRANASVKGFLHEPLGVQGKADGTLDNLYLRSLMVRHLGNLVSLSAMLQHPLDPSRMKIDGTLHEVTVNKKDLQKELGSVIPDAAWAYVPDHSTIKGMVRGNASDVTMDLKGMTTEGNLAVAGKLTDPADKNRARYDLRIDAQDLALQRILKDTTLGPVSAHLSVEGAGYDLATMRAKIDGQVRSARYMGYTYRDIILDGALQRGQVNARLLSADPQMDMDLSVSGNFSEAIRDLKVDAELRKINLQALGFMKDTLVIRGKLNADINLADSSHAIGHVRFDDLLLETPAKQYFLDTMDIVAYQFADTQFLRLNAPFAQATLKGQFRFDALPEDFMTVLNGYIQPRDTMVKMRKPAFAEFTADVHLPDTLLPLIPHLEKLSPFVVRLKMDTRINQVILGAKIPLVEYGDYRVDSLMVGIGQDDTQSVLHRAAVAVSLESFYSPWVSTNRVYLAGQMDKGMFNSGLVTYARDNKTPLYAIPFSFYNDSVNPYISLGDSVILNTYVWEVNKGNRLFLNPHSLTGSNLRLSKGKQELNIMAAGDHPDGLPLTVRMNGFQLESLTALMNADSALIKGEVNASATFTQFSPLDFRSDLRITGLKFRDAPLGDLSADLHTVDTSTYKGRLGLHGAGNDLDMEVAYRGNGNMQADANITSLRIAPLAYFVKDYADSLRGLLAGRFTVEGHPSHPALHGSLSVDSMRMILVSTGTPISVPKAGLELDGQQMTIKDLTILDSAGRPAVVKGLARFNGLDALQYDLRLDTKDFLVAGHKRYPKQLLYGPLRIASQLTIKGNLEGAAISGNADVRDSSSITYVYREGEAIGNADGLIEFFNPADSAKDNAAPLTTKKMDRKFALSANSYLSITPKSTLNIILSEESGDKLSVTGKSSLNFSMNESGGMELVGIYEVETGIYNLSIAGLIRKEFLVNKGSTITWTGDVKQANVNLTAVYKVKTDAAELVQDLGYLPGITKQKFEFLVYMDITGDLMKPDIRFRLDMKQEEQAAFDGMVYTRIKQVNTVPSELNKQVMGLLALQTFIADNPFSSVGGGGNFQTEAYSTAGNLLTRELNNFIANSIKDVDIDIGLDIRDDYSSGSAVRKSDLKVGLAKSFNNNRLNVYVGSTFALENQNQQQDLLNGLAGDVTLEYLLTRDGRYRLKGYRIDKHDITFNGEVVETGATFVVVLEFNKLKNAFKKRKTL